MSCVSNYLVESQLPDNPWTPCLNHGSLDSCRPQPPYDPEANNFCQGRPDGFYYNNNDCQSYFLCFDMGKLLVTLKTTFIE